MIKKIKIIVFCSVCATICFAQEHTTSIKVNTVLQNNKTINFKKTRSTIALPFLEDFSNQGPYPNPALWQDNKVYINNTFGVDVPSQGVATFDGLDEYGNSYHPTGNITKFSADSLTSQQILLGGLQASDSVYMSFLIQPQGNGFMPEVLDSIKLLFLDVNGNWITVWGKQGSPLQPFKQIMIPITANAFLHNAFQFRFINIASPNTNDDDWNLDYIKINKNRNYADTFLNDLAFALPPSTILQNYTSMPYRQFIQNTTSELAFTYDNNIKNNYNVAQPASVNLLSKEIYSNTTLNTNTVSVTTPALTTSTSIYNTYSINYMPANINNDVLIRHTFYFNKINASDYSVNDTISHDNIFSNYYAYDDGSNEKAYFLLGWTNIASSTAMSFTLNVADTLHGLAIKFANQVPSGEGKLFNIVVYDSLGTTTQNQKIIYTQNNVAVKYSNTKDGFTTYKLDTVLALPPGKYYIGTTQLPNIGADSIYFGLDANTSANTNNFFYNVDGNWQPSTVTGTTMFRPIAGGNFIPTALKENLKSNISKIFIYPNPTNQNIHLQNNINNKATQFAILDIFGNTLIQKQNINSTIIDVQQLPTGQYFLQLYNIKNNIIQNIIFTKQ